MKAFPNVPLQEVTNGSVELAFVDQGYTGENPQAAAAEHSIRLEVVKLQEAKRGFVLLPRRWVVERSFGWAARFRRLARDYERLSTTLAGLHWLSFATLMPSSAVFFSALKVVADGWRPCHKAGPGVQAKTNHPL